MSKYTIFSKIGGEIAKFCLKLNTLDLNYGIISAMLSGLKTTNTERVNEIHERVLQLSDDISFRIFPIYIRYLKGDDMFALLYFNLKDYNELGIATNNKISDAFEDASWMKYKEIKYSTKIKNDDNLDPLFKQIKASL